ncbi:L-ascorbate oxidase-like [Senna tora]|uniref:L-ascorbate oxidase n=1 Tax=Senna tora TaxID=362788 RepID=A0A834T5N2_9FABA|nr:L-ascorbate oxidase-like [Senna tora]
MEGLKALIITLWCVWVFLILSHSSLGDAKVRHYKFDVEYFFKSVDCVERLVMGINGQFPGPTIRAEVGDTLDIAVTNKLSTDETTIHWHGIRQYGTPWADGTAFVTQCAINSGETFHYRFKVDKAGTFFYHAHNRLQITGGLYGSLIVDLPNGQKEPFHYDDEIILLFSDWWHKSVQEQDVGLTNKYENFRWVWEAQSILINGRGQFGCSLGANFINHSLPVCHFKGDEDCAPYILSVLPNKTYRIRIASVTSLLSLNLAISNHKMVVVEADGYYVQPFTVDNIDIYSGESYSVLLTTDQNPNQNYWISVGHRDANVSTTQALTLLNYNIIPASVLPSSPPPVTPPWDDDKGRKDFAKRFVALKGTPKPPKYSNRRIVLLGMQVLIDDYLRWSMNGISLEFPPTPYLGSMKFNLRNAFDWQDPPENYPQDYDIYSPPEYDNSTLGNMVYKFELNQVVDVILQNANSYVLNATAYHPWHLHGHDFWVLAYGEGKFKDGDEKLFNLENPPMKNTVAVFPYSWTAIRFRADNPGVWLFHCHMEPHFLVGMGVVFAEGVQYVNGIPEQALACGLTAEMLIDKGHDLIRMAPHAEAVENLLDLDYEDVVRVVEIHGMGRDREDDSCCSYV